MKTPIALLLCLFMAASTLVAQSKEDKEKAKQLGIEAIGLVDDGKYETGIKKLEEASKLDPKNAIYKYEIAYAYYLQKKYKEAAKLLEAVVKMDNIEDSYYQLLGNTYDYLGDPEKAMDTYIAGLKKFPNSGRLHLEQGVVYLGQKAYDRALEVFEKGVRAEPTYPSNYYWLAKLYTMTDYPVYSAIYGEIFMNLERTTKRTEEISKLLYSVYEDAIVITDTNVSVKFVAKNIITMDDLKRMEKGNMPFTMDFEITMGIGAAFDKKEGKPTFSMAYLNNVRKSFLSMWFGADKHKSHPNPLFDLWKRLDDKGYFDAYNYWLFMKGADKAELDAWMTENDAAFDGFITYFVENPIDVTSKNYFHSGKFVDGKK